jgi:nicotinamide-nucleotide amidase
MKAEVIAIGDELTTGQRLDTNSQWISRELAILGIPTGFHTTISDSLDDGVAAFRLAIERADIVIASGGLGPTADDLTRDVLALVAHEPLELSAEALVAVEAMFARRAAPMPESNRRQALFPRTSRIIPNPTGTAPGIDIMIPRQPDSAQAASGPTAATPAGAGQGGEAICRVFALPGVPSEMKLMWQESVRPTLHSLLPDAATIMFRRIKCFGAGESAVEAMLPDMISRGRDPLVGITAHEATITLRIVARGRDEAACLAKIAPTEATIRECLGGLVYGVEEDEIEDAAVAALVAGSATLATVEIATQGQVAAMFAQAQARRMAPVLRGGVVLAAIEGGQTLADLAESVRSQFSATHGLAIGPVLSDSGTENVEILLLGPKGRQAAVHRLGGAGTLRLSRAAKTAIDLVRKSVD